MFKDDCLAVSADRRKAHVAALERSYFFRFAAAFGDAPDVGEAVSVAIAHKVDAVLAPHRPRIETVKVRQLRKLFGGHIFNPDVGRIGPAIVLAPINLALRVVGDAITIRRIAGRVSHVRPRAPGQTAVDGHDIKQSHEVFPALAAEEHARPIRSPTEHDIVGRVMSQLPGRAARGRNNEHVEVAVAVAREGNPFSVG